MSGADLLHFPMKPSFFKNRNAQNKYLKNAWRRQYKKTRVIDA